MSLTVDILRKLDEFGFEEVLISYSKEDIDDAIKGETRDEVKAKLKILSKNWKAAEEAYGSLKTLAEIITDEDDDFVVDKFGEDDWDNDKDVWGGEYDEEDDDF